MMGMKDALELVLPRMPRKKYFRYGHQKRGGLIQIDQKCWPNVMLAEWRVRSYALSATTPCVPLLPRMPLASGGRISGWGIHGGQVPFF